MAWIFVYIFSHKYDQEYQNISCKVEKYTGILPEDGSTDQVVIYVDQKLIKQVNGQGRVVECRYNLVQVDKIIYWLKLIEDNQTNNREGKYDSNVVFPGEFEFTYKGVKQSECDELHEGPEIGNVVGIFDVKDSR